MATGIRGEEVWKIIDSDLNEYSIKASLRDEPDEQEIITDVLTTEYSVIENNYFGQRYKTTIYIFKPTVTIWSSYKTLVDKEVTFYPNIDNILNAYTCRVTSVRPVRKSNATGQQYLKIELESNEYATQRAE